MSIIGIDIGTTNCVIAQVAKGSVQVVRNELADRLTPSLVAFTDTKRSLGDHALSEVKGNYKNTCRSVKNVMGKKFKDPAISEEISSSLCKMEESENGTVVYSCKYQNVQQQFSPTTIMAALLQKLKLTAEKSIGKKTGEAVISFPDWYTQESISCLKDAADVAGIHCLQLMRESSAISLDYGLFRNKEIEAAGKFINIMFVSMGHSTTTVFITRFANKTYDKLVCLSSTAICGRLFTNIIVEKIAESFLTKHKVNPLENKKVTLTLEDNASKMKHVLSANQEAAVNIECLIDDYDLNFVMSRKEFEDVCKPKFAPILDNMLKQALDQSNLSINDISAVEIAGGSTRIPFIQQLIENATKLKLSKTLNQDETVARGCALQAAMKSEYIRAIAYNVTERYTRTIAIEFDHSNKKCPLQVVPVNLSSDEMMGIAAKNPSNHRTFKFSLEHGYCEVMPINYPQKSTILVFRTKQNIELSVMYADPNSSMFNNKIGDFLVELPPEYQNTVKEVRVYCELDSSGIFCISKAFISDTELRDETYVEQVPVEAPPRNTDAESATSSPLDAETTSESAVESEQKDIKYEQVNKTRKVEKNIRIQLQHKCIYGHFLPQDAKAKLKSYENSMHANDLVINKKMEKLNELETKIYDLRSKVGENQTVTHETHVIGEYAEAAPLHYYLNDDTRTNYVNLLNDTENWIYNYDAQNPEDCGQTAGLETINNRHETIANFISTAETMKKARVDYHHVCVNKILSAVEEIRTIIVKKIENDEFVKLIKSVNAIATQEGHAKYQECVELSNRCKKMFEEKTNILALADDNEQVCGKVKAEISQIPLHNSLNVSTSTEDLMKMYDEFCAKCTKILNEVGSIRNEMSKVVTENKE